MQPAPVVLPGNPHGQRSLAVYSSWDCQELDTTERLNNTQAVVAARASQGAACWAGPCGAAVLWALVGGPFFLSSCRSTISPSYEQEVSFDTSTNIWDEKPYTAN